MRLALPTIRRNCNAAIYYLNKHGIHCGCMWSLKDYDKYVEVYIYLELLLGCLCLHNPCVEGSLAA